MEKEAYGITQGDIERVRKRTHAGDKVRIRTCKGVSTENCGGGTTGVVRKVTVVDTGNKRFCTIKLPSGVTEMVLWSDLVRK